MKILMYNGKLVEESFYNDGHNIGMRVIKDEDKDKCPHCGKPIPTEIVVNADSSNYQKFAKPVDTLPAK